jgi:putative transcriptional regulator
MSKFGNGLLRSARQAREIARGTLEPAQVFTPPTVDVAAIRKKTGLSQTRFAQRFGFSAAAVRDWEQNRRVPDAAARTLLLVIEHDPVAVEKALEAARQPAA